jgi:hypothetical protein
MMLLISVVVLLSVAWGAVPLPLGNMAKTLCQSSMGVQLEAAPAGECYRVFPGVNPFHDAMRELSNAAGPAGAAFQTLRADGFVQLWTKYQLSLAYHRQLLDVLQARTVDGAEPSSTLVTATESLESLRGFEDALEAHPEAQRTHREEHAAWTQRRQGQPADPADPEPPAPVLPSIPANLLNPNVHDSLKVESFSRGLCTTTTDLAREVMTPTYQQWSLRVLQFWRQMADSAALTLTDNQRAALRASLDPAVDYYKASIIPRSSLQTVLAIERFPNAAVSCIWSFGLFLGLLTGSPKCDWKNVKDDKDALTADELAALVALQTHCQEMGEPKSARSAAFGWTVANGPNLKLLSSQYYGVVEPYMLQQLSRNDRRLKPFYHMHRLGVLEDLAATKTGFDAADFAYDSDRPYASIIGELYAQPPPDTPAWPRVRLHVALLSVEALLQLDLHADAVKYLQELHAVLLRACVQPTYALPLRIAGTVIAIASGTIATGCLILGLFTLRKKRTPSPAIGHN